MADENKVYEEEEVQSPYKPIQPASSSGLDINMGLQLCVAPSPALPLPPQLCALVRPQPLPEFMTNYKFECKLCHNKFYNIRALCGHMRVHKGRKWRGLVPPPHESSTFLSLRHIGGHNNPDPGRHNLVVNNPLLFNIGGSRIMTGKLTHVAGVGMSGGSGGNRMYWASGSNLGKRPALSSEDPLWLLSRQFKRTREEYSIPDLNEELVEGEEDSN